MTDASDMLRIMHRCRKGHLLGLEDGELIADAIEARIRGLVRTLDEGLELDPNWPSKKCPADRDKALGELIAAISGSGRARAKQILEELRRYATAGFRRDVEQMRAPPGRQALLFKVLVANGNQV